MTENGESIKEIRFCKRCGEEIAQTAIICPKCRYSQINWVYYSERFVYFISVGLLLVNICALILSVITLITSVQQTKKTTQALKTAEEANKKSESTYKELKAKIDTIDFYIDGFKKQQYFNSLGSRAISYRDRNAYDELDDLSHGPHSNSDIIANRNQVIQFWSGMETPLDNYNLQLPIENDTATTEQTIGTLSLANILLFGEKYEDRIKCAYLLGDKRNDKNAERILLLALYGDGDIEVALKCGKSLTYLDIHMEYDFLDADKIFTWWKNRNIYTYKIDTNFKSLLLDYRTKLTKKKVTSKNKYEKLRIEKTINIVKSFI